MIIHLKPETPLSEREAISRAVQGVSFLRGDVPVIVTPSSLKEAPREFSIHIKDTFICGSDLQLGSRTYLPDVREVSLGPVSIGGATKNTAFIAGPCSVENEDLIEKSAKAVASCGIKILRAGCFKPRTSPYSFQGLGLEGLKLLAKMRDRHGLAIITEVRDATHFEQVAEYSDIIQVGAKAMYDQGILRGCGTLEKPILIKRHFGATLQEFVQAAEFVLSGGNENVILCERGIRTFETGTRFTLDLCGVSWLKEKTNLPIFIDPSHAMGYAYGVADLTRAAAAMGIDGLLIESHPNPNKALSDAAQQIDFPSLEALHSSLSPILNAIGRNLV